MSYFALTMRRRLFAIAALADFSIIVNGVEYKPGDTVTITASTTVTIKGNGKASVTLIGGGGGGGDYIGDLSENYNCGGDGGDGGTSIFTEELVAGTYDVIIGTGGNGGAFGSGQAGGTTNAFGHSAGGGGGGDYADDWGDGMSGSDGIGETSSGNTTKYGQGGYGTYSVGGNNGTSGVCIINLVDPNAKNAKITMMGTFDTTCSYVMIDGSKTITPGEYEVPIGSVVTLAVRSQNNMSGSSTIIVNGQTVVSTTATVKTYDYEVVSNCTINGTRASGSFGGYRYTLTLTSV